jgi:hypothetical protein
MGNWLVSLWKNLNSKFVIIEPVGRNPEDRIFKSEKLSSSINDNTLEVKEGYRRFSENETDMNLLYKQATAVSGEVMTETLNSWKDDLMLNASLTDYHDFNELLNIVKNNDWPADQDSPWESTQENYARTNLLYFCASCTDAQKFNVAICHLITYEPGVSQNVLFGGLWKKDLLRQDIDNNNNIYLNFH